MKSNRRPTGTYSSLQCQPLTAALGATVVGVDLNESLGEDVKQDLRNARCEHLVLFFRGQHIDDEHHLALAECFGEPEVHPIRSALGDSSKLHDIVDTSDSLPDRDGWHTDVTYMERPPSIAILRCLVTPEYGGDTVWANMILAYDKLSDGMKVYLDGLKGFHATDASFNDYIRTHLPEEACEKVIAAVGSGVEHPLVRTHPETGAKALFVDRSFMTHIEGLGRDESRFLHEFLASRAHDLNIQCRFKWAVGDVAVWDECATQHAGIADHAGSERILRRCTVAGERPR